MKDSLADLVESSKAIVPAMCEHVYKEMGTDICPLCGKDTHKVNWEAQHELHREWIASGKATPQGWWSI
jgi:RNA polymerase subunit RPABC4/transcription elongation factor Spt4